jgi:hypothetical protein
MAGEIDQTFLATGDVAASGSKVVSGMESNTSSTSSSSNVATQTIIKKEVPMLYEHWKASMVTEADLATYYAASWLPGEVLSSITDLKFLTIDKTVIVYFESDLMAGLTFLQANFLSLS